MLKKALQQGENEAGGIFQHPARVRLVGPQPLIPLLLVARRQGSDVHRLADLTDVPACQARERLGLPLIEGAEGSARPSFLLLAAPR